MGTHYDTLRELSYLSLRLLSEANLNRIMSNAENYGIIIISANHDSIDSSLSIEYSQWLQLNGYKDDTGPLRRLKIKGREYHESPRKIFLIEKNKANYIELYQEIKKSPYSYSQVYGGFQEKCIAIYKPSFIIYCTDRKGNRLPYDDLFEFGKELCKRYNQDSFYAQAPGETPHHYDHKGDEVNIDVSKLVKFNSNGEQYFTTIKRPQGDNAQQCISDIRFEGIYGDERRIFIFEHYARDFGIEYVQKIRRVQAGEVLLL